MTLTTTTNVITYTGNGATTIWSVPFRVLAKADLEITILNTTTGVETPLSASDFTVTTLPATTSTVTYPTSGTPLSATQTITIRRVVAYTQDLNIQNQTAFDAGSMMLQLDEIVMQIQQIAEEIGRSIRITASGGELSELASGLLASKLVGFDSLGNVQLYTQQTLVNPVTIATVSETVPGLSDNYGPEVLAMWVLGYYAAGDGGHGLWRRINFSDLGDLPYFRTGDLYTTSGTVDAVEGGYWTILNGERGISVKAVGAKGDNTNDDAAAIQSAINSVESQGGGRVFFPDGEYLLKSKLTIDNYTVVLVGEVPPSYINNEVATGATSALKQAWMRARMGTVLRADSATVWSSGDALVNFTTPSARDQTVVGCGMENLAVDGQESIDSGIEVLGGAGMRFTDVGVYWCDDMGFSLGVQSGNEEQPLTHSYFENCFVMDVTRVSTPSPMYGGFVLWGDNRTSADDGVQIRSNVNFCTLVACRAKMAITQGFQLEECDAITMIGCAGKVTLHSGESSTKTTLTSNVGNNFGARHNQITGHQGTITCKAATTSSGKPSALNIIAALTGNATVVTLEPGDVTTSIEGARAMVTRSMVTESGTPQRESPAIIGQQGVGVQARKSAVQSVPNATPTQITWALTDHDILDSWVIGNPGWFTVPDGVFALQLAAQINFASDPTGYREIQIQRSVDGGSSFAAPNGAPRIRIDASATAATILNCSTPVLETSPGEIWAVYVVQTSGGALNIVNNWDCWATIRWL